MKEDLTKTIQMLRRKQKELHIDLMTFGRIDPEILYLRDENREWLLKSNYRFSISLACRLTQTYCELLYRHLDAGMLMYFKNYCNSVSSKLDCAAHQLCEELEDAGYRAFVMPGIGKGYQSGEPGIISHIALARLSGMGSMGDGGMLLTPEFGPRIRLSTILTDCPFPANEADLSKKICTSCGLCKQYCPSGAITGNHFDLEQPAKQYINKEVCSAYRNKRPEIVGNRFCNLCMAVCPIGKSLPVTGLPSK